MFNWALWFMHLMLSIAVVSGFMAFYTVLWRLAFGDDARNHPWTYRMARPGAIIFPLFVIFALTYAVYIDPMNDMLYRNLRLLILSLILLDDRLSLPTYAFRSVFVFTFLMVENYYLGMSSAALLLCAVAIATMCALLRYLHNVVHYNFPAILAFGLVTAVLYWFLQANLARINALAATVTYLVMVSFAFLLWKEQHVADVKRRLLQYRADVDELTGAQSFAKFRSDYGQLVAEAMRTHKPFTMAMLDIDHFKALNDKYGHLAGNAMLVQIATLLTEVAADFAPQFRLYRTGGEEFNLVFPGIDVQTVRRVMTTCWQTVRTHQFAFEGTPLQATISVGIVGLRTTENADALYKRADNNLYLSKRHGRDTITVEGTTERLSERQVASYNFAFFSQPIVGLRDGQTVRHELKLRWFDETRNRWVAPNFYDVTVPSRIMLLDRSARHLQHGHLAVNLQTEQFMRQSTAHALAQFVASNDHVDQVIVEITDRPDLPTFKEAASWYRQQGIALELDQINNVTDAASVAAYLPLVDGIKFVIPAERGNEDVVRKQVQHWTAVAQEYGLTFTLAGIETASDVVRAKEYGILLGQGNFFARPTMPQLR
ncbi:sensor domain-containing diguanylate cyclase [Lacticaseibacillus sharpeae]|nr:diguanylate cyclase [Lacticaseibacillus sharpeae]